ncbi:MAG: hypothetical protein Tsb0021_11380 [Chlamydiales bacterium]
MEQLYQDLMSNPWVAIGVPLGIFIIALLLLIRRIISFAFTIFLFVIVVAAGYSLVHNETVQNYFGKENVPGKQIIDNLTDSLQCFKKQLTSDEDDVDTQRNGKTNSR